jgi:thiol:disulfide interchange protein DsbC
MRIMLLLGAVLGACLAFQSQAEDGAKVSVEETIASALRAAQPNLVMQSATQVQGQALYEVELTSGEVLYTTPDGRFFIYGSLFEASEQGLVNLTAKRGDAKRQKMLASVDVKDMVVFPSKGEQKAVVSVFTDVDCGYCRKLHREVPKLNELGITVRYLAYPRAGVYTDASRTKFTGSYKKLKSVWCDSDPAAAMSKAKATGFIKENLDCEAPIEAHLALGEQFGVRGTPALIFESGELVPGYMPADQLAKKLGL